jgi:hypothetical protein
MKRILKVFDACHATRHTGSWGSTINGSQVTKCDLESKEMPNRIMKLL